MTTISCTLVDPDAVPLQPNQTVKCQLHKYHRLREPTLKQTIEALIYTHSLPGHAQKKAWRHNLAVDIMIHLRERTKP